MTINFFDCVQERGIFSLADKYFDLPVVSERMGYRTFRVIDAANELEAVEKNSQPISFGEMLITALKVASYLTLILPVIALIVKAVGRALLMQELEKPQDPASPAIHLIGQHLLAVLDKENLDKEETIILPDNLETDQSSSIKDITREIQERISGQFPEDQATGREIFKEDIPVLIKLAEFAVSPPKDLDVDQLEPVASEVIVTLVQRLKTRLRNCTQSFSEVVSEIVSDKPGSAPPDKKSDDSLGLWMGEAMMMKAVEAVNGELTKLADQLEGPSKKTMLEYGEEVAQWAKTSIAAAAPKTQPNNVIKPVPKAPPQRIKDISSGEELARILNSSEKDGYHIDVDVTEKAVIEYLEAGGKPELAGTFFYCLDLRNPILSAHAEAIIRHAPRLVEVQGLNGQNAQGLIPLLANCENLKHLHLEIKWGEAEVDLSPLANHSLGRVAIIGEGVTEEVLRSLIGARIEKLRIPPGVSRRNSETRRQPIESGEYFILEFLCRGKGRKITRVQRL